MTPATAPFVVMAKPVGPTCNFRCDSCYYLERDALFAPGAPRRMGPQVLEALVRRAIEENPGPELHMVWHGGEPTLAGLDFYRRAVAVQQQHLPDGWRIVNSLQTNGWLIDDRWAAFLAENRFAVGLSLDGPQEVHDAGRRHLSGAPTHERVVRALRLLRRHGIDPDILCTLTATSAAHPAEVYRYFREEQVRWVQFLPVVVRAADGTAAPISVGPEAFGSFLCQVFDEWVRHDVGRIDVQVFVECLLALTGRGPTLCTMAATCGRVPVVEHDGGVYACDHFVDPEHKLGDVTLDGLASLLETPRQESFGLAKRDGLTAACRNCLVLALCRGGCPKDRFVSSPDGEPGHNHLCGGYRQFLTHALPVLSRMAALSRRGRPATAIMTELAAEEADDRAPWRHASRNGPCPCGSGRKFKHCCLGTRRSR